MDPPVYKESNLQVRLRQKSIGFRTYAIGGIEAGHVHLSTLTACTAWAANREKFEPPGFKFVL